MFWCGCGDFTVLRRKRPQKSQKSASHIHDFLSGSQHNCGNSRIYPGRADPSPDENTGRSNSGFCVVPAYLFCGNFFQSGLQHGIQYLKGSRRLQKTPLCADHHLPFEYSSGCCVCCNLPYGSSWRCTCNSQLSGSQCHSCNLVFDAGRRYLPSGIP